MKFVTFGKEHLEEAKRIAWENYLEERVFVPALPEDIKLWDLNYFAKNGLGVAALNQGKLAGFLCWFSPWSGAFDTKNSLGTFSPLHANGAIKKNRYRIYQDMYEEVSKRLANQNVQILGISLYAHDEQSKSALFEYGFGMRCKDCILRIHNPDFAHIQNKDLIFEELPLNEFPTVRELRKELNEHLKEAPCFMQSDDNDFNKWITKVEKGDRRTFVAKKAGQTIAYLDVAEEAETFVTCHPKMRNLKGAYCKPEFRGMKIIDDLLLYVLVTLKSERFEYLGVDFESYNPTANRFWGKHFAEYTNSVTRKIELWSKRK